MKIERTYVSETPCHIDGLRTFVYRWYDDSKSRYVETNIYKKGTKHIFQHNLPVKVQREIKRMIREGDFVRLQIAR